jgi:hypothetical protein
MHAFDVFETRYAARRIRTRSARCRRTRGETLVSGFGDIRGKHTSGRRTSTTDRSDIRHGPTVQTCASPALATANMILKC